jgi:tetratricopeptide (TPR) repeat protein
LTADETRREGMLAWGALLPAVRAAVGHERPARDVLAIGEVHFWDIPARVRTQVLDPPFVWRACRGAGSATRIAIRFRQANIGWILFNGPLAGWGRFTYSPYDWRDDELRLYAEFVRTRLRLVASSPRSDPNYGCPWLFSVAARPLPPAARLLFLPGAERAYTFASLAAVHGAWNDAIKRFRRFAFLPPVASIESMEADALLHAGRLRETLPLLRRTVEDGLLDETNLLDLAVAAGRLGRRAEAARALARAERAYPLWPERVATARREAGL